MKLRRALAEIIFGILDFKSLPRIVKRNLINATQAFRQLDTRFTFSSEAKMWFAWNRKNPRLRTFGTDLRRLYQLNMYGIDSRRNKLAQSYFLDEIQVRDGDTIVDVGANWGDIFGFFSSKGIDICYFAFEPNPDDFRSLSQNVNSPYLFQVALGDEAKVLNLFLNSQNGDSSLLEPASGYSALIPVQVLRLDTFFNDYEEKLPIKILKVEAEGFEPEVLQGAVGLLSEVEYCAIDGGPERGLMAETTIETVLNFLVPLGFYLIRLDVVSGMGRALLRNVKFQDNGRS